MSSAVYQLFTIGWKGDDIFIGSFSTLEKAQKRSEQMRLSRRTWVDLDVMDAPVDEQNTVWVLEPKNSSTSNGHH
jgi:hypothetical protein